MIWLLFLSNVFDNCQKSLTIKFLCVNHITWLHDKRYSVLTMHLATLHIPRRHLRKRKPWAILGLFYVPLEFQPMMKNWIYRHSTGFLNYTSIITKALYCWVCQMFHGLSFHIINMYSVSNQNRASELLWHKLLKRCDASDVDYEEL